MNTSEMLKMPVFAMGTYDNLEKELSEGGHFADLSTIMYAFVKDGEYFAFVHPSDKKIHLIKGNNKPLVQKVDRLPSAQDGDEEVLYICDDIVYSFNGEAYIPTYTPLEIRIEDIEAALLLKANKATTLAGYGIEDAYTIEQISELLNTTADSCNTYTDNALTIKRY